MGGFTFSYGLFHVAVIILLASRGGISGDWWIGKDLWESRSRDSVVANWSIRGSNPGRGKRFFSSPKRRDRLWAPLSLLLKGYRSPFPWVQRSRREVTHSPPSSAPVKNRWSYTSTPIRLHDLDRENFAFLWESGRSLMHLKSLHLLGDKKESHKEPHARSLPAELKPSTSGIEVWKATVTPTCSLGFMLHRI
jgi:hypothetical protein